MVDNNKGRYFFGGLAETISNPSDITFEFFRRWFAGNTSIGLAMDILGLPVNKINLSIIDKFGPNVVVNLDNEEQIFYKKTIYKYTKRDLVEKNPNLELSIEKIFNVRNIVNTSRILYFQSKIIADKKNTSFWIKKLCDEIPDNSEFQNVDELASFCERSVWPNVLAIGYISNFYSSYLEKTDKNYFDHLHNIQFELQKRDWLYLSTLAMYDFLSGHLSYEEFIKKYGLRADNDYELTCPRWYEIPEYEWKKRKVRQVKHSLRKKEIPNEYLLLIDMIVYRSEARRKTLKYIDLLRQLLLKEGKLDEIISMEDFIEHSDSFVSSGVGKGVSRGAIKGKVCIVKDGKDFISDCICIFPSAGTEYSNLYSQCTGLIFLSGGIMSHGSIVAREYGIPAIIDESCITIKNGETIEINGDTGEWKLSTV